MAEHSGLWGHLKLSLNLLRQENTAVSQITLWSLHSQYKKLRTEAREPCVLILKDMP